MKRIVLGVVLALVGVSVNAQTATPLEYYQKVAGQWAGRQENVKLVYSVHSGAFRVEGESCNANAQGPESCLPIDQGYLVNDTQLLRDDQRFGARAVEILEMTDTKIVRRELNPVMKDRVAITTEELTNGGHTLMYTVEVRENGKDGPKYFHQFTLDRVSGQAPAVGY